MISEATDHQINTPPRQPSAALAKHFGIGDWLVLPDLNRLQHRHLSLHRQLEPRLIHLLCYLAANTNQVLSRQALVQELWPTVVVNENSLTRAISELRKQLISPDPALGSTANYIDTIPKKGYRLLPAIILASDIDTEFGAQRDPIVTSSHQTPRQPHKPVWLRELMPHTLLPRQWQYRGAISALCLSLLVGSLGFTDRFSGDTNSIELADELLENTPEYFGGELTLSTMNDPRPITESIAKPVVSLDEKQYAFIQYDNAGSTIFLGDLGTAQEPVPVYYSNKYLFNLAWAPVGNNLLFAMKPGMTTTALFSSVRDSAELVLLDLDTYKTSRLIQQQIPNEENSSTESKLT